MRFALNLDKKTSRILSATYEEYAGEGMQIVDELPAGDIANYLYIDGAFVYDPIYTKPIIDQGE